MSDWKVELPANWKLTHGPVFADGTVSMGVCALDEETHDHLDIRFIRGEEVRELEVSLEFPETFDVDGHTYPCTDRIYRQRDHGGLALTCDFKETA